MNEQEAIIFLFTIAKEIKRSFETPVILVTMRDYADVIFSSLVDMRDTLIHHIASEQAANIIHNFHLEWLQAVQDIENLKKRIKDTPREVFLNAFDYTLDCVRNRHKHFQEFIDQMKSTMTTEENALIQMDIGIIGDMRDIVTSALLEKQKYLRDQADQEEFCIKLKDEINELLFWIDRLNDYLALQFSKILDLRIPHISNDLTKILQHIIDEITASPYADTKIVVKEIQERGRILSSMVHIDSMNELEIRKVIEKIKVLEDRVDRLKNKNSFAVIALQHKTQHLEERLKSLEDFKISLDFLKCQQTGSTNDLPFVQDQEFHIFNHMLPHRDRCRLVEQLVKLWNSAIGVSQNRKSVISIFSAADIKEVFSDDMGQFTVDRYGRKLYTFNEVLYQLNEHNELTSLQDDSKHVYFYDQCGRYYLNDVRQRVYKAYRAASEYVMHKTGMLVKVKEEQAGVVYWYDNLGRYYINQLGNRIYQDGSEDEYENDGLGNLVKIRTELSDYELCPDEPMVLEESMYLKKAVGDALKKCIAEAVMNQPENPVQYLADSLEKYGLNLKEREKQSIAESEMFAERKLYADAIENIHEQSITEEQLSIDLNFVNYESLEL